MRHTARAVASSLESRRLLANPIVIDVLAVYTPGAVSEIGSVALLKSRLQDSIDAMNRAMSNSKIAVSVRLVHVDPVTYTGQQDLYLDRTALEAGTGGLSAVAALRNTYGADLVTMVVENQFGGGNASLMAAPLNDPANSTTRAFSAIAANSFAPYNYTLAHELGHNLGAGHERGNPDGAVGPFPYSYGYRFTGTDSVVYHDLMSYNPGVEVPYYANPAVSVHGTPTGAPVGSPNQADLAATFTQTAPVVSAYRASIVADVAPSVTLDTLRMTNGFAYIGVRYDDDSGIDLSSIDSDDLTLTIPGLPTITPVLDSIENPGVGGAFNRVTYRAYLRDVPVDPTSIIVGMKANAVKDITGKFVPATISTIPTNAKWTAGYGYSIARDLGALSGSIEVGDALGDLNSDDVFTFTLANPATVSTRLTGLTQDASVFIAKDTNGDGVYQSSEIIDGSYRTGTTDDTFTLNLAAGTYYAWVFNQVTTPYKLVLSAYTDTVAPTAKLDATDITAATNTFTFNVAFDDDVEVNAYTARYYSPVRVTNPFGGYYISFANAIDFDVNGPHRVVTYQINAGFTLSASDNGVYTVALEPNVPPVFNPPLPRYVGDGAGNSPASSTPIGTFRVAIGGADNVAPTFARTDATEVHRAGATASYDFDVTFADNVGITTASLNASQVTVTGPDNVARIANAISVSAAPAIGSRRTVRYRLTSLPGGSWDSADYGTYNLALVAGTVKDAVGNTMAATALGSFKVSVPLPGDANNSGTVDFNDLVILAQNYNLTAQTFAQGNFDDDPAGNVDFNDLVLLAQRYGTSRLQVAPIVEVTKESKKRLTSDVLT
jgi:hypothetical protein